MRRLCIILALAAIGSASLLSLDMQELFRSAVDRDLELKRLAFVLEGLKLDEQKAQAGRGLQVSVGTGSSGVSVSSKLTKPQTISATVGNALTVTLGEPLYSRITVGAPLSYTPPSKLELDLNAGVSQSLNSLLRPASHMAADLGMAQDQEDARIAILSRQVALKREIVSDTKAILAIEIRQFDSELAIRDAQLELDRAKLLGSSTEGGSQIKRLENTLWRLQKEREQLDREYAFRRRAFEEKTGAATGETALSASLQVAPPSLAVPGDDQADLYPALALARMDLAIAEQQLAEERAKGGPDVSVRLSYSFDGEKVTHTLGGGLDLSWKLFDGNSRGLSIARLEDSVAAAKMAVEKLEESFALSVGEIDLEVLGLAQRREILDAQKALKSLEAEEARQGFQMGITDQRQLDLVVAQQKRLDFDELALLCDTVTTALKIEALTLLSPHSGG